MALSVIWGPQALLQSDTQTVRFILTAVGVEIFKKLNKDYNSRSIVQVYELETSCNLYVYYYLLGGIAQSPMSPNMSRTEEKQQLSHLNNRLSV